MSAFGPPVHHARRRAGVLGGNQVGGGGGPTPPSARVAGRRETLYARVMLRIAAKSDPGFEPLVASLVDRAAALPDHIEAAARDVIRQVRRGGDTVIRELTQ